MNLEILLLKAYDCKMSIKQGHAVWWLLENRNLMFDKVDISGSFRYNAGRISNVVRRKTNYMTFYCSRPIEQIGDKKLAREDPNSFTIKFALQQMKVLEQQGGKVKNTIHAVNLRAYKKKPTLLDIIIIKLDFLVKKIYAYHRRRKFKKWREQ